jgi:hypothetical protein
LGKYSMGRGFPGGLNFSWEILHWGTFGNSTAKFFYLSYSLFADSILHVEMLKVIVRCKFSTDGILKRIFSWGDVFVEGETDFTALFKCDQKLNKKTVRSNI